MRGNVLWNNRAIDIYGNYSTFVLAMEYLETIKQIVLVLLLALHDYYVIKSYGNSYTPKYKDYWHWCKFWFVALVGYMLYGATWETAAFYMLYYIVFETALNVFRSLPIFYVGVNGVDGLKGRLFRKYDTLVEGILKAVAFGLYVLFKNL